MTWQQRLAQATETVKDDLSRLARRVAARSGPPAPGDVFVVRTEEEIGLEWLIVREHPDDADLLFVVPLDDFPFAGTPDAAIPHESALRPLFARCGQGTWVPTGTFESPLRVDALPEPALQLVRRKIGDLARGQIVGDELQQQTDDDVRYEEWIAQVEQARERLQSPSEEDCVLLSYDALTAEAPPELAFETPFALAAEGDDSLAAGLQEAINRAGAVNKFYERRFGEGKLVLVVNDQGVFLVWIGNESAAPKISGAIGSGETGSANWEKGPKERLLRSRRTFPWFDGEVVIRVAPTSRTTIRIRK